MILYFLRHLYFLLFSIFVFLLLSNFLFDNIKLDNNFIFLFSFLAIPVVDVVITKIRLNVKMLLFTAMILFSYAYVFSITWNEGVRESLLTYSYIFLITGSISQYIVYFLHNKNERIDIVLGKQDKNIGDYFYIIYVWISVLFMLGLTYELLKFVFNDYMFWKLAWVFLLFTLVWNISQKTNTDIDVKKIFNNYLSKITKNSLSKFRKWLHHSRMFKELNKAWVKSDIFFHIIFILFTILFVYGFIFDIVFLILLSYSFIFITYIVFKIYWFNIDNKIDKKISTNHLLGLLIIYSWIFWIWINELFNSYWLNGYKNIIVLCFIFSFMICFLVIFSDIKFKKLFPQANIRGFKKKYYYRPLRYTVLWIFTIFVMINFIDVEKNEKIVQLKPNIDKEFEKYEAKSSDKKIQENRTIANNVKEIKSPLNSALDKNPIIEDIITLKKVKIGELYKFNNYLSIWNESEDTRALQKYLKVYGSFKWEVNWKFDIYTRNALKYVLMYECHWPETTKWVLWKNAAECVEWLEIEVLR